LDAARRGTLTLGRVAGSVRAALASGVSLEQIITTLAAYGLCWEPETKTVRHC
jgi:hypothetical protein